MGAGDENLVLIIRERASFEQVEEMLQILGVYIKIAVDIEKGILAGGGKQHAECEAALLKVEIEPLLAEELVNIQVQLAMWELSGNDIWSDEKVRSEVAEQFGIWSGRVLDMSGLLSEFMM